METKDNFRQKQAAPTVLSGLTPVVVKTAAGGVFHLAVAGFALLEADGANAKWFAAILVVGTVVNIANEVATAASRERRRAESIKSKRAAAARRSHSKGSRFTTWRQVETTETEVERDPLQTHATVFYTALLVGLAGIAAALYGILHNVYFSTLGGSVVATIGFAALACALISAESIGENPGEDARPYGDGSQSEHSTQSF